MTISISLFNLFRTRDDATKYIKLKQCVFFYADVKNVFAFKLNHNTFLYKDIKCIVKVFYRFGKCGC